MGRCSDGDGYGDNAGGNNADAFPDDATQWSDQDGDGFGDNQAGTVARRFPNRRHAVALTQDGDGYGDNPTGNAPDAFPADATQWTDGDHDGFGDNAMGNDGDQCLNTPAGRSRRRAHGCSCFSDWTTTLTGSPTTQDACPATPAGEDCRCLRLLWFSRRHRQRRRDGFVRLVPANSARCKHRRCRMR